jgi:lipoprotein-anchoring transpeptidase ErfK/SrfK
MRRICIPATLIAPILAGAISGSALAQSLRPSFTPDGMSQAAPQVASKRIVHAHKVAPTIALQPAPSRSAAVPQSYAAPMAAPPPANPGLHDFFATIFAGPILLSRAFRPSEPSYGSPAYPPQGYVQQAYAAPNQTDPRDGAIDPKFLRQEVDYPGREAPGTIIVDTSNKFLYLIEDGGRASRYGIGVGRPGFLCAGTKTITAKRKWPDWRPPTEMLARRPDLLRFMPGGIG